VDSTEKPRQHLSVLQNTNTQDGLSAEGKKLPANWVDAWDEITLPGPVSYYQDELSSEQQLDLDRWFNSQRHGPVHGWTRCRAEQCPYYNWCPLQKQGARLPEGEDCPVESGLVQSWIRDKIREFNVENNNDSSKLSLIRDLAYNFLEEWRVQVLIAKENEDGYLTDSFRMITPQGDVIQEPKVNPLHAKLEKIHKRKSKILDQLMATPEQQSKDRGRMEHTMSQMFARLKNQVIDVEPVLKEDPIPDYDKIAADKIRDVSEAQAEVEKNRPKRDDEDEDPNEIPRYGF